MSLPWLERAAREMIGFAVACVLAGLLAALAFVVLALVMGWVAAIAVVLASIATATVVLWMK